MYEKCALITCSEQNIAKIMKDDPGVTTKVITEETTETITTTRSPKYVSTGAVCVIKLFYFMVLSIKKSKGLNVINFN